MNTNAIYINSLYQYNYWAYNRIWNECIIHLSDEQFSRDLGYSLRTIHGQLVHAMSAEWIWFSRLHNESVRFYKPEEYPTRESIRTRWSEIELHVLEYTGSLRDTYLEQPFTYHDSRGQTHSNPLWQILLHVANHGTDHRAQILSMVYQVGGPTIEQDYIIYLREIGQT